MIKKHYVCTHYGIQECMTSNDFGEYAMKLSYKS